MKKFFFFNFPTAAGILAAAVLLSACIFETDDLDPGPHYGIQPGVYLGDHGDATRLFGLQSLLILDSDATFRFLRLDSNSADHEVTGNWSAASGQLLWEQPLSCWSQYTGEFTEWDTLQLPDTSWLRAITDSGFERLEVSLDVTRNSAVRWVHYQRLAPTPAVADGAYEYTDSIPDYADITQSQSATTRYEFHRNGFFSETDMLNGVPDLQTQYAQWWQAGPVIIANHAAYRFYNDSSGQFGAWTVYPAQFEKVLNIRSVADSGFQMWVPWDFSNLDHPYWADFQEVAIQ